MRTKLLPIALLGLMLLSPLASAQAQQPTLTLEADASDDPATGTVAMRIHGLVTLTADAVSSRLALSGVPVTLSVVEAPEWALVTFSPESFVLQFEQPGVSTSAVARGHFVALVHADDREGAALGVLKIEARSASTSFMTGAAALVSVVVTRAADCHHEEPVAGDEESDLVLQSATPATPTSAAAPWGAVAVGTVAAVGVALVVRRKFF